MEDTQEKMELKELLYREIVDRKIDELIETFKKDNISCSAVTKVLLTKGYKMLFENAPSQYDAHIMMAESLNDSLN